jgi:hypothetical protein
MQMDFDEDMIFVDNVTTYQAIEGSRQLVPDSERVGQKHHISGAI